MASVDIKDLGIRFKLDRRNVPTLRRVLLHPFKREKRPEFWAIRHVNLTLQDGDILGISGPNGIGKSTLLRSITGIYQPDEGTIITQGRVSLLAIGAGFILDLTGIENIYQNGAVFGFTESEIDELVPKIVEFSGIGDFVHQPIRTFSSGMISRLGFAVAINLDPDILLIDEVMAVGDAAFKKKSEEAVMELIHRPGKIVVIVSHSQNELDRICTRQLVMEPRARSTT